MAGDESTGKVSVLLLTMALTFVSGCGGEEVTVGFQTFEVLSNFEFYGRWFIVVVSGLAMILACFGISGEPGGPAQTIVIGILSIYLFYPGTTTPTEINGQIAQARAEEVRRLQAVQGREAPAEVSTQSEPRLEGPSSGPTLEVADGSGATH